MNFVDDFLDSAIPKMKIVIGNDDLFDELKFVGKDKQTGTFVFAAEDFGESEDGAKAVSHGILFCEEKLDFYFEDSICASVQIIGSCSECLLYPLKHPVRLVTHGGFGSLVHSVAEKGSVRVNWLEFDIAWFKNVKKSDTIYKTSA